MKKLYTIIILCSLISYTAFPQTISSNAPLCGNQNLTLELTATGGTTYAWKGPNGFSSTLQKPSIKNVNWKNRGVYTVTIDNKTTLTTDVNIKDPVAFTVPKEISVYRSSTLLIEPKNSRLTDSTEIPVSYSFINPKGILMSDNAVPFVLENNTGTYKVVGNSNSSGCSTTQTISVNVIGKASEDKFIEMQDLSNIKICYGQDFSIPFYPSPSAYFKEGTKYKIYLMKKGDISPTNRQPDAIVDRSPFNLKGISNNYYERVLIVADDIQKTMVISSVKKIPDTKYVASFYQANINSITNCDTAKLSSNYSDYINSIQWFKNGIAITGANSPSYITQNSGTYSYTFKGNYDFYDINKTCIYETKPVKIEIGKIKKPDVNLINSHKLCLGENATLSGESLKNKTYQWKKNGLNIPNATSLQLFTNQPGKYLLEIKENKCTAVSDTIEVRKTINPEMYVGWGYSNSWRGISDDKSAYLFCQGQNVILASLLKSNDKIQWSDGYLRLNNDKNLKFQWFKNGIAIKDSVREIININKADSYSVSASYGECSGFSEKTNIQYSNYIKIPINKFSSEICENLNGKLHFDTDYTNVNHDNEILNGKWYRDDREYDILKVDKLDDFLHGRVYSYYNSTIYPNLAGNYYVKGTVKLKDGSLCNIVSDTAKLVITKKQKFISSDYNSVLQAIPLVTCKDTIIIEDNNNLGIKGRATSYKWTKDGVILKQDSSNILQATQAGIYQLETTYKESCPIISSPYKVEFGKIDVSFYNPASASICDGVNYPLRQKLSEYSSKNVYFLSKDGQFFSDVKGILPDGAYGYFNLTQPGTYKLKVTNGKCEGTSPDFVLKVDKIPTSITPSDSVTLCAGKTVDLKVSTEAGLSYIWERNGSVISQANQATLTASADGLYKATLLRGACWGTTPSVKLKTLANILPVATLTGDKKIDYDTETKLSINLTSHAPWTFKLSDGKEYTATKSPFEIAVKPLSTTTYSVTEVKNICGTGTVSGSAKIEIIILSAEEEKELNVEVFPMPSSEICNWKIETPQATTASVELLDGLGMSQFSEVSSSRSQSHSGSINLSNLKAGTYFLKLHAGEKSVTRKVVKF